MVNNSDLPPEFVLAAACCRWPQDAAFVRAVAQESQSATDWQRLLRIAGRHRVSGLVGQGLRTARIPLPAPVAAELAAAEHRIALADIRAAAETARLAGAFAEAGVDALTVKGATLARLAYGFAPVKEARDIDLLVAPDSFAAASRVLAGLGYRRLVPNPAMPDEEVKAWLERCKEAAWLHDAGGHLVELHVALTDHPTLLPAVGLGSPRRTVPLGPGIAADTLADAELNAYLFVHGATHGWFRLKWLADVNALLGPRGPDGIRAAWREAVACGAGRSAGQGLLLCERLLGLELGEDFSRELAADRRTRYMVSVAANLIAGRFIEAELDDSRFGTVPLHFTHFLIQRGVRPKLAMFAGKLKTPFGAEGGRRGIARTALSIPIWLWRRARRSHQAERGG